MGFSIDVVRTERRDVRFLKVEAGVRYWEDAKVNGEPDEDGSKIPCRKGDTWCPLIDLDTGIVEGWPSGTTASIHYKVCDAGHYELLDVERNMVAAIDGYVPKIMCPGGDGYGDYIIMDIGADGKISGWKVSLAPFKVTSE